MDFIKTLDGHTTAVKRYLVVPKELFNITDSIEISRIDVSTTEIR